MNRHVSGLFTCESVFRVCLHMDLRVSGLFTYKFRVSGLFIYESPCFGFVYMRICVSGLFTYGSPCFWFVYIRISWFVYFLWGVLYLCNRRSKRQADSACRRKLTLHIVTFIAGCFLFISRAYILCSRSSEQRVLLTHPGRNFRNNCR